MWNARNGNLAMDLPGHEDEVRKLGTARSPARRHLLPWLTNMCFAGLCRRLGGRRENGRLGRQGQGCADVEELSEEGGGGKRERTGADDTLAWMHCLRTRNPIRETTGVNLLRADGAIVNIPTTTQASRRGNSKSSTKPSA